MPRKTSALFSEVDGLSKKPVQLADLEARVEPAQFALILKTLEKLSANLRSAKKLIETTQQIENDPSCPLNVLDTSRRKLVECGAGLLDVGHDLSDDIKNYNLIDAALHDNIRLSKEMLMLIVSIVFGERLPKISLAEIEGVLDKLRPAGPTS